MVDEPDYAEDFNPEFALRYQAFRDQLEERAAKRLGERGKLTKDQTMMGGSVESITIYSVDYVDIRYSHYGNWYDERFTAEEFFTKAELRVGKINSLLE